MRRNGYDPYRGRGGFRTALKVFIGVLIAVLVLAVLLSAAWGIAHRPAAAPAGGSALDGSLSTAWCREAVDRCQALDLRMKSVTGTDGEAELKQFLMELAQGVRR